MKTVKIFYFFSQQLVSNTHATAQPMNHWFLMLSWDFTMSTTPACPPAPVYSPRCQIDCKESSTTTAVSKAQNEARM